MADQPDNEADVRRWVEGWAAAVRAKDAAGCTADYAPDVLVFDVVDPLRYVGVAALRRRLEQWFGSFRGPIGFEVHDLTVTATDQLAFCSSLNRVTGTKTD